MKSAVKASLFVTIVVTLGSLCQAQDSAVLGSASRIATAPFTNDFELNPFRGWTRMELDGDSTTWRRTPITHSGFLAARADSSTHGSASNDWLITPQITVNSGDTLMFWARLSGSGAKFLRVRISSTTVDTGSFAPSLLTLDSTLANQYTKFKVGLSPYAGQSVYIAFVSNIVVPSGSFFIDDIYVGGQSSPAFARNVLGGVEIRSKIQYTSHSIYAFGLPEPTISISSGPSGASLQSDLNSVVWNPPPSQFGFNLFSFHASNSLGTADAVDSLEVNSIYLHNVNNVTASLTDDGELGNNLIGSVGFVINGKDELYGGGLVVGTSTSRVSTSSIYQHRNSFVANVPMVSVTPPLAIDQQYVGTYSDRLAIGGPLGITVTQNSYAKSPNSSSNGQNYANFIIIAYTIKNASTFQLSNLRVGLTLDWDVGNFWNDGGGFSNNLGYMYELNNASRIDSS